MIVKGSPDTAQPGRTVYPLDGFETTVQHFVVRETGPDNPFVPHKHEQTELWYVIEGEGVVTLDGEDKPVSCGDLIRIHPWLEHGLRSDTRVTWICLG